MTPAQLKTTRASLEREIQDLRGFAANWRSDEATWRRREPAKVDHIAACDARASTYNTCARRLQHLLDAIPND